MATRKSKRKKKARVFSICLIIIALVLIVGCGLYILNEKKTDTVVSNITPTTTTTIDQSQPTENNSEEAENKQESKDDLFDLFLNGKIDAEVISEDGRDSLNASSLDLEGDEWDSYHFYDYRDVNNDGDTELMLSGPYGYSFFDIRDNKVILFEDGQGTGATCILSYYKDTYWIVQAHAWEEFDDFSMHRYEGSTLAETIRFGSDEDENGEKYFYRSLPDSDEIEKISESEYNELIDSILQD